MRSSVPLSEVADGNWKTHRWFPEECVVIAVRIPESLQLIVPFELDKSTVMIALQPRGFVGTDHKPIASPNTRLLGVVVVFAPPGVLPWVKIVIGLADVRYV